MVTGARGGKRGYCAGLGRRLMPLKLLTLPVESDWNDRLLPASVGGEYGGLVTPEWRSSVDCDLCE